MKSALSQILLILVILGLLGCQSSANPGGGRAGMVVHSTYQPQEFPVTAETWAVPRFDQAQADELAIWLVPDRAANIVNARKDHVLGTFNSTVKLYEAPRPAAPALCEVTMHWVLIFLVPSENGMVRSPSSSGYTQAHYRADESGSTCPRAWGELEGFTAVSADAAADYVLRYRAAQTSRAGKVRPPCDDMNACAPALAALPSAHIRQAGPCVGEPGCLAFTVMDANDRLFPRSWSITLRGRDYGTIDIHLTPPPPPF